ncbi:hypothetical protein MRX96_050398 [Rhipicephalus microplus]
MKNASFRSTITFADNKFPTTSPPTIDYNDKHDDYDQHVDNYPNDNHDKSDDHHNNVYNLDDNNSSSPLRVSIVYRLRTHVFDNNAPKWADNNNEKHDDCNNCIDNYHSDNYDDQVYNTHKYNSNNDHFLNDNNLDSKYKNRSTLW